MKRLLLSLIVTLPVVVRAQSLSGLATVTDATSARAASNDPTGLNADCVWDIAPGETRPLMSAKGPGRITHLWFTVSNYPHHTTFLRDLVLRIYWDDATVPSIDVPMGDFFALGHGRTYAVTSAPIAVGGNDRALNCYWPMPFHKAARVEVYNNGTRTIRSLYYHVDHELGPQPESAALFHAAYHRDPELPGQDVNAPNKTGETNYVILDTQGRGQYVGCALFVDSVKGAWWGEGDDMIFVDDDVDRRHPTLAGTGSEDYFNNAWGYKVPFSYPYYGCPLLETRDDGGLFTSVYRFHVPDPIRFKSRIKVTLEHNWPTNVNNDFSSVAYWYQTHPVTKREPLPKGRENHPHVHPSTRPAAAPATVRLHGTELEEAARAAGLAVTAGRRIGETFLTKGGILIMADQPTDLSIHVPTAGTYRLKTKDLPANTGTLSLKTPSSSPEGTAILTVTGQVAVESITLERTGN